MACSKNFATEKAYENHIKSKKHLEALKAFQAKDNREEIENNRRNRKLTEETTMEEDIESDDEEIELADFKKIKTKRFYQKPMSHG